MTADIAPSTRALHERAVIIDGRDPTFLVYRQSREEKPDYWSTLEASGLTASVVDVPWIDDGARDAMINFALWHERISRQPRALLVRGVDDILRAKADGLSAFILSSQTPTLIEDDIRLMRGFYELGLRVMQLTYQKRNLVADGCGETNDGGLSAYGRQVVAEMNRLGISIDLSHAGDRTMDEAIDVSAAPVFCSHSNARARVDVKRNVPDATLRRLAERDGVCGVSAYSAFLKADGATSGTTLEDYLDMLEYIVELIGIDHVSMGFDVGEGRTPFEMATIGGGSGHSQDATTRYVRELNTRSALVLLTDALVRRGYDDDSIAKFLGGNLLRFFETSWAPGGQVAN